MSEFQPLLVLANWLADGKVSELMYILGREAIEVLHLLSLKIWQAEETAKKAPK
jgi:hypothetical protein